jgi:hypothetical protein
VELYQGFCLGLLLLIWLLRACFRRLHPRIHSTRSRAEPRLILTIVILLTGLLLDLHRIL